MGHPILFWDWDPNSRWAYFFFRPSGAYGYLSWGHPRLAPWAAFFRRFAAGVCREGAPSRFEVRFCEKPPIFF